MALLVQKYDGPSIDTIERIHRMLETDAQASTGLVREANQFVCKLFAKG